MDIVVAGTGGLAREFTSFFVDGSERIRILGYSSTNHVEHEQFKLPGQLFKGEISPSRVGTNNIVIAIGDPVVKQKIYEQLKPLGFKFPSLIHPSSVVSDRVVLEPGVVISPNCVISPNVTLKSFSYINFCCGIGHDAVIGNFVQINPGSQLGGFSSIGDETLIGSGTTILQGVNVGEKATVASGSVVFARVKDRAIVMGNPAKRMRALEK